MTSDGFLGQLETYDARARGLALEHLAASTESPYLRQPAEEYLHRGGKGLRPALCLATCGAFGGEEDAALPSAAALELFHTSFLIHDDLADDSEVRRGAPTLHRTVGAGLAINAGDGLAVAGMDLLRDNDQRLGRRMAARVWGEFAFMARQTVEGQAQELGWIRDGRTDLTPDDYLDLIMQKTSWYTTVLPLRVGALIGGGGAVNLDPMVRFGFSLGAAFQIRDDVLNLTGRPERTGKEPLGDLREGKRTLMLIHLRAAARSEDRAIVDAYLARSAAEERDNGVVQEIYQMLLQYGSIAFADQFAQGIAGSARDAFEEAFADAPETPQRRFVSDLIDYMVQRDR
jgi:geranylgeranyl diphosphate synthase type II